MSSEWTVSELGKEAVNASRPFSFSDHPGVVFVNTGDVLRGNFLHANVSAGFGLPGQAKKAIQKSDILLTEIRPGNGRFAFVDFDASKYVVSTKFMVIESLGRVSPRFLFHLLTNQSALDEFQRIAESRSGTFPQITFDSIAHFPIPVPPAEDQSALTAFFDALDDRITLLRDTNATLEAIAQALFKSWFVDFDPVRAKMEGRAPEGMDEATAALFPDSFEESELGLVPRGWRVGTLDDCCSRIESGGTPKRTTPEYWDGDISWLTSGEVRNPIVFDTKEKITALGVKESSAKLWPNGTTVVAMYGATAGEVCLLAQPTTANQACCGLIPRVDFRAFLFFCVRRERESLASKSSGSAQQNLNKGLVSGHQVLIPSEATVAAYEGVVGALLNSWIENERQAQTLATLRDTLLPRLISGQLRLPQAQAAAEEALA
jgi:type I restriction enzyme S subunit